MTRKMWFGNKNHAQWVPCPATGMTRSKTGFYDEIEFENGGIWIEESAAWHNIYSMEFPVSDAVEYDGIEAFNRFASGEYDNYRMGEFDAVTLGDDTFLYFVDPMYADENAMAVGYAQPGLIMRGWKNWGPNEPQFSADDSGVSASWDLSDFEPGDFVGVPQTLLIPPNATLNLSVIPSEGDPLSPTGVAARTPDGVIHPIPSGLNSGRNGEWTLSLSGSDYRWVEIALYRESTLDRTLYINNIVAAYSFSGSGALPPFQWPVAGRGHTGLKFRGKALPETYVMSARKLVGMSAELVEVEAWK